MVRIQQIESLENPGLAPYRTLRRTVDHERQGIFVAEGEKVVARLMESGLEVVSVLTTKDRLEIYAERLESQPGTISVFVGDKSLLNTIVGFHLHQGIMAVARIPKAPELSAVVNRSVRPLLFVAIDGMTNSENLGVLVRNCVAFGVQALIVGETSSSPYLRRAVRNSMGTIFKLPVLPSQSIVQTIRELKSRFFIEVIAAHPRASVPLEECLLFEKDCCIVFGSEGNGISQEVLDVCTGAVAVPMKLGVDSLNVSSAGAVFLYEVARRRAVKSDS